MPTTPGKPFGLVDDIVNLGKWAYGEIPDGFSCKGCPLLTKDEEFGLSFSCSLRSSFGLSYDGSQLNKGPSKDSRCPKPPKQ